MGVFLIERKVRYIAGNSRTVPANARPSPNRKGMAINSGTSCEVSKVGKEKTIAITTIVARIIPAPTEATASLKRVSGKEWDYS